MDSKSQRRYQQARLGALISLCLLALSAAFLLGFSPDWIGWVVGSISAFTLTGELITMATIRRTK